MHGVRRCRSKPFPPFRGSAYQSPMKSTGTFSRSSNHRTWARSFEAAAASTGDVLNDIARASHRRNSANFASAASHPVRVAPSSVSLRLVLRAIAARDARRARERTHRPSITAHRAGARRPLSPDPVPRVARARYLPRVPRARVPPPSARVSASARPPPRAAPFPAYSLHHRRPRRPAPAVARRRRTASSDRASPPARIRGAGAVPFDRAAHRPIARSRAVDRAFARINIVASIVVARARFRISRTSQFDADRRRAVSRIVFNRCRGGAEECARGRDAARSDATARVDSRGVARTCARADAGVASRASRARVDAAARDQPRGRGRRRRAYAGAHLSRSGGHSRIFERARTPSEVSRRRSAPGKKIRPARNRYFRPGRLDCTAD